jgi:hypothetical protein
MGTSLDGFQPMAGYQQDCERQARQALGETALEAPYAGPAAGRHGQARGAATCGRISPLPCHAFRKAHTE